VALLQHRFRPNSITETPDAIGFSERLEFLAILAFSHAR